MLLISYGEEKPADLGEADDAHGRNRRVEFQLR
jgi:outer membrane protein OmpA-like peptidoglycan-associated protein